MMLLLMIIMILTFLGTANVILSIIMFVKTIISIIIIGTENVIMKLITILIMKIIITIF